MRASPSSVAEGKDGCLLSVEMTDLDVIGRVGSIFDKAFHKPKPRNGWKQTYVVRARGSSARYWMNRLRPLMGVRRQAQIDAALAGSPPSSRRLLYPHEIEMVLADFQAGVPAPQIAAKVGVAREHIYRIAKRNSVSR